MPPSLAQHYGDFLRESAYEALWGRDTSALDDEQREILHAVIQAGVRAVLSPLIPGTAQVYEWTWARPVRTIILRPEITGTLLKIPTRDGDLTTIEATEAIFDSDVVGLYLQFDDSEERYEIVEYVRESVVRVAGVSLDTELVGFTSGVVQRVSTEVLETVVTQSDATSVFYADNVGDLIVFDSAPTITYSITRYISTTEVAVAGDVTGLSGAFTVRRQADVTTVYVRGDGNTNITCASGTFRQDMEDDSDTVTFIGGTSYTIEDFQYTSVVMVTGSVTEDEDTDIYVEKSFSGSSTAASVVSASTLEATEELFDNTPHKGMYVVLLDEPYYPAYEIIHVVNLTHVVLAGNALRQTGEFAIAHAKGRLPSATPVTYDGATSTVTADSAIFDSTMVGHTMHFLATERKYTIAGYTSTTVVTVVGDVRVEEPSDAHFMVVGPTDLAAADTFTLLNTGGDYELPDDFAAIDGPLTYGAGENYCQIEIVSEATIRAERQRSDSSSRVVAVAIRPKAFDARVGQRLELMCWPYPAEKKTVSYRYQILHEQIDETHKYPPGGPLYGELYLLSCLAMVEQRVHDKSGLRTAEFRERLAAMIDHDRRANQPEYIGGPPRRTYGNPLLPAGDSTVSYDGS